MHRDSYRIGLIMEMLEPLWCRFRPKSTFMPHVSNPSVHTFCRLVDQDVFHLFTRDRHFFLSVREREALRALSEDVSIVIKPADKGGAVVIQDIDS